MSEMTPCPFCKHDPVVETGRDPYTEGYSARVVCRHWGDVRDRFRPVSTATHVVMNSNVEVAVSEVIRIWNEALR